MTEQQILDKTIKYLNKYSNCFKNFLVDNGILIAYTLYSNDKYGFNLDGLINEFDPISGAEEYYCRYTLILVSEFRIAYNIIKDLAQNSTHALG